MSTRRDVLVCGGAALLAASGEASAATPSDWRAALREMTRLVETVHPRPFFDSDRDTFLRAARDLERALPRLDDEQRMARLMRLAAMLGDGHTQIEPTADAFRLWYPIRLYEFSDGYYITSAHASVAELAGAHVLEIGGRPVAEAAATARALHGADNPLDRMERIHALHCAPLMRAAGIADPDGALHIKVQLADGRIADRALTPLPGTEPAFANGPVLDWRYRTEVFGTPIGGPDDWRSAFRDLPASAFRSEDRTRPPHLMFRRARIAHAIPEASAYYMQLNLVGDAPNETMGAFAERALREVDALRPRALIVDLRYNFGGDGSTIRSFIHAFIRRGAAPPWGELYVLTGRRTFSAGVMMIAAFIDHTHCTFIGEPAGGALDHYGDATSVKLPGVGALLNVSTLFHQLQDQGQRYDIMPVDVAAPFSFADWSAGRDPAVDPILAGAEMRSVGRIAIAEGGAAARRVFDERMRGLESYRDWMMLREHDLIRAMWALNDQERHADSVELARIMVELRPDSAVAHSRLGRYLIATDRHDEGLAAYREALRLDPANLDNIAQRQALAASNTVSP